VKYLQEVKKYEMILLELGVSTLHDLYYLEDPFENPIDTLFLSIFNGDVIYYKLLTLLLDSSEVYRRSFS
jgi:hypothetical protein